MSSRASLPALHRLAEVHTVTGETEEDLGSLERSKSF